MVIARLLPPLLLWPLLVATGPVIDLDDWSSPLAAGEPGVGYGSIVLPLSRIAANSDSPDELLIAAPTYDGNAGQLWLVAPPAGPDWEAHAGELVVQGESADQLGRAVAAGDLNDDGWTDLVVSGSSWPHGRVWVMWGDGVGWSEPDILLTGTWSWGDEEGSSLAIGDLDGDGVDDLIVGSSRGCWGLALCKSELHIYGGRVDLGPASPAADWLPIATLGHGSQAAGAFVRVDLDWNCDGLPDLTTGGESGALLVLMNPSADGSPLGWTEDAEVGSMEGVLSIADAVSGPIQLVDLGEATGDACPDVLIGSPGLQGGRGEIMVIAGRPSEEWLELDWSPELHEAAWMRRRGRSVGEWFGASLTAVRWTQPAGSGEIPKPDLLIGAPSGLDDDGHELGLVLFVEAADLWGGPDLAAPQDLPAQEPWDFEPLTNLASLRLTGVAHGDGLGRVGAGWVDLDGDGLTDPVVMAGGYHLDAEEEPTGGLFALTSLALLDRDDDGVIGWLDCDDADAARSPEQPEVCDGVDNDCDGALSTLELDDDGDGFTECDGDCDDEQEATWPGGVEICDGLDNDCDGRLDGDEIDDDGDGVSECEGDCEDADPTVHPGAPGSSTGEDTDCDGSSDWLGGWSCSTATGAAPGVLLLLLSCLAVWGRRLPVTTSQKW